MDPLPLESSLSYTSLRCWFLRLPNTPDPVQHTGSRVPNWREGVEGVDISLFLFLPFQRYSFFPRFSVFAECRVGYPFSNRVSKLEYNTDPLASLTRVSFTNHVPYGGLFVHYLQVPTVTKVTPITAKIRSETRTTFARHRSPPPCGRQ